MVFNLFLVSCQNVLDKYPLDTPSYETFYNSADEIEGGVNACYSFLQETNANNYVFPLALDGLTNLAYIRENNATHSIALGVHDDVNSTIVTTWSRMFQGVARCNVMIEILDEKKELLSPTQFSRFKGELHFLRGYYYSKLLMYFGDVPLITSPIESVSDSRSVIRDPKIDVYSQIMQDFTDASQLLPLHYDNTEDLGRATRGSANAYLSRIALYMGDYSSASNAAEAVINSEQYELYPSYADLFYSQGLFDPGNKEVILKVEYSSLLNRYHTLPRVLQGRNPVGGYSSFVPTQYLVDSYMCIDGKNINESPLFDKNDPFSNRDPRLSLTIVTPSSRFGDFQYETHIDSVLCWNYATNTRVNNNNCYTASPIAVSHTGYLFRKYSDPEYVDKLAQGDYPIILCRYAEVLLNYAEAKIEMNDIDESVVNALNLIRQGRNDIKMPEFHLSDFQDLGKARKIVRQERKIELAMEGFRYHDLIRWGLADKYNNLPILGRPFLGSYLDWPTPNFDENGEPIYDYNNYIPHPSSDYRLVEIRRFTPNKNELWPIPQKEIVQNSNLNQNAGY